MYTIPMGVPVKSCLPHAGVLNVGAVTTIPSQLVAGRSLTEMTLPITPTVANIAGSDTATLTITVAEGLPFCHYGRTDAVTTVGGCPWTVTSPVRGPVCADTITLTKAPGCATDWVAGIEEDVVLTDPMLTATIPSQTDLWIVSVMATQGTRTWSSGAGLPDILPIEPAAGVKQRFLSLWPWW